MKKEVIFCIFILTFLLIPIISAIDTEINIKTFPNHEVQVTPYRGSSYFGTLKNYSNEYGDASFVFSSDKYEFNLIVIIKKDGEIKYKKNYFEDIFFAGDPIYLEVAPKRFDFIETPGEINESKNEINNSQNITITENETEIESGLTGFAIFGEESSSSTYLVIGIILLLLVVGFIIFNKLRNKSKKPKEIKIKKLSELQAERKEKLRSNNEIIEDAERRINEAQEEIRRVKSGETKEKVVEEEKI